MTHLILITLFLFQCSTLLTMEKTIKQNKRELSEKQKKEFYPTDELPLAQNIYAILHPVAHNKKNTQYRAKFLQNFSLFQKAQYPIDTKSLLFERSFLMHEEEHQQLLSGRDVPLILLNGSLFLDTYKKNREDKKAFTWAYNYLYTGALKQDPFCERLFSELLFLNDTSQEAQALYKNNATPNQAETFYNKALLPRTYLNPFTQRYQQVSLKRGTIYNPSTQTTEFLKQFDTWEFTEVKALPHLESPEIHPDILNQFRFKKTCNDQPKSSSQERVSDNKGDSQSRNNLSEQTNTHTLENRPLRENPTIPQKNHIELQKKSLKLAQKGLPGALYNQIKIADTLPKKLILLVKLLATPEKYNNIQQQAISLVEPDILDLLKKQKNNESLKQLSTMGILESCLPFAKRSAVLKQLCTSIIQITCKGVWQDYDTIFKNIPQIINFISKECIEQPEITLMQAEYTLANQEYTECKPLLVKALDQAKGNDKQHVKNRVLNHIETLQKNSCLCDDLKKILQSHKVYIFDKGEVTSSILKLHVYKTKEEANAVYQHKEFKSLLEDTNPTIRYGVALWLSQHKNLPPKTADIQNKLIQQLAQEKFLPAQIDILEQQSEAVLEMYKKESQKKHRSNNNTPSQEYGKNLEGLLSKVSENLFEQYPDCRKKLQKCVQTLIVLAEKDSSAQGVYAKLLLNNVPGCIKKQRKKAFECYFNQNPASNTINNVELFREELEKESDIATLIKGHTWFIKYYNAHDALKNGSLQHLSAEKVLNKQYSKKDFIEKLLPQLLNQKSILRTIIKQAQKKEIRSALLYAQFMHQAAIHGLTIIEDSPLNALPNAYIVLADCLSSCNDTEIKKKIGELCAQTGNYYMNQRTKLAHVAQKKINYAQQAFNVGVLCENNECEYKLGYLKIHFPREGLTDSWDGLLLLKKSALHGNVQAAYLYGKRLLFGPPIDMEQAHILYHSQRAGYQALENACQNGSEKAAELLKKVRTPTSNCHKPLNVQNPQACYEYGQYLFDECSQLLTEQSSSVETCKNMMQEALTWLTHAQKSKIPQVNFYIAAIDLYSMYTNRRETGYITLETVDAIQRRLAVFLQDSVNINNPTEQKQLATLALRTLINIYVTTGHIASGYTALDYLIAHEEDLLAKQKIRSVASKLCLKILLKEIDAKKIVNNKELLTFLKNNLGKLEKIAEKYTDATLHEIISSIHQSCLEKNIWYTDKVTQFINARKYIEQPLPPTAKEGDQKMQKETLKNMDEQLISLLPLNNPIKALNVLTYIKEKNIKSRDFCIIQASLILQSSITDSEKYRYQDALKCINEALEIDRSSAPLETLIMKKKLLEELTKRDPENYNVKMCEQWCKELQETYNISNVEEAEQQLEIYSEINLNMLCQKKSNKNIDQGDQEYILSQKAEIPLAVRENLMKTALQKGSLAAFISCIGTNFDARKEKPKGLYNIVQYIKLAVQFCNTQAIVELREKFSFLMLAHVYHTLKQQCLLKEKKLIAQKTDAARLLHDLETFLHEQKCNYDYIQKENQWYFVIKNAEGKLLKEFCFAENLSHELELLSKQYKSL